MAQVNFARPDFRFRDQRVADGMNTTAVLYYRKGSPFNNLMYQAEDIVRADGVSADFDGTRDANGYPLDYGTATTWIGWYVWSDIEGDVTAGDWVLNWEGGGNGAVKPRLNGIGSPTTDENQRRIYNITDANFAQTIPLRIDVADIDTFGTAAYTADPIRNVRLEPIALEGTCLYGQANLVRQKYIDAYKEFEYLRVMNIMATNQQGGNSSYLNRRPNTYRTFTHGEFDQGTTRHTPAGVPFEVALEIVNQVGIRGWFNIPHEYDDASITWWFETLRDNYNHALGPPGCEWSNEFWNDGAFIQGQWCQAEGLIEDAATGRYGGDPFPLWFHGAFRSSQAMRIGNTVMDAAGLDWSAIIGVQTGRADAQSDVLNCNISDPYNSESTERPKDVHTTIGVSFYVGNQAGRENFWSNSGAKDNSTPVPGTGLNTINWDPDVSKLYTYFDYMIDTFHTDPAESDSWQSAKNRITADDPNWEVIGYEGNHHLVREFGGGAGADGLAWWQTLVAEYETEAFSTRHRALIDRWTSIFGSDASMCHFVLLAALKVDGHWAYYNTIDEAIAQQADQTYRLAESMRNRCGHNIKLGL